MNGGALNANGVAPGLSAGTEHGGLHDAIGLCCGGLRVQASRRGPTIAHVEGHIAFGRLG